MKTTLFKIILLINVLFLLNAKNQLSFAQDQQLNKFVGKWLSEDLIEASMTKVSFKSRNGPMRYNIIIEENNGQLLAVLDSPDRYLIINADEITISGDSIRIKFNEIDAIYRGKLNSDKDQLFGSLIFLGRMFTLGLRKNADLEEEKQITSQWIGKSLKDVDSLDFVLKTYKTRFGVFKSYLDIPNNNHNNIVVENMIIKSDSLIFKAESINGYFEGRIFHQDNSIKGIWKQNNKEYPVEFIKYE